MIYLLSVLPIVLLIILSLVRGVKEAVWVGLLVTTVLFFYFGAPFSHYLGTLGVSIITTLNILMIVFGAAFLYNIMDKNGFIQGISHSLDNLHPSNEIKFFLFLSNLKMKTSYVNILLNKIFLVFLLCKKTPKKKSLLGRCLFL